MKEGLDHGAPLLTSVHTVANLTTAEPYKIWVRHAERTRSVRD